MVKMEYIAKFLLTNDFCPHVRMGNVLGHIKSG
jgi:hypothetical protein